MNKHYDNVTDIKIIISNKNTQKFNLEVIQPSIPDVQAHMLLAFGPCSSMSIPSLKEFLLTRKVIKMRTILEVKSIW